MEKNLNPFFRAVAAGAELVGRASVPHSGWVSLRKTVKYAFSGVHPTSGKGLSEEDVLINLMADMEALLKDDGYNTEREVRRDGRYLYESEQLIRWDAAYELIREYNGKDAARHFIEREIGISNIFDESSPGGTGRLNSPQIAQGWGEPNTPEQDGWARLEDAVVIELDKRGAGWADEAFRAKEAAESQGFPLREHEGELWIPEHYAEDVALLVMLDWMSSGRSEAA
jgi:hypothetical protein